MTLRRARSLTSRGFVALILGSFAVYLAACSPAQNARIVADGQLFCARATGSGPLVVAIADAAGVPVLVTGLTSALVADTCAAIGGIPVIPPPDPSAAPVVAVVVKP